MRHSTFFWFFLPTAAAMLLFIAFPILSVVMQSIYAPHSAVLIEVETCTPLVGCTMETTVDQEATAALRASEPLGRFVGLDIFFRPWSFSRFGGCWHVARYGHMVRVC